MVGLYASSLFPVNGHFIQNPCPIFGCTRGNFMLDWHKGGGRAPGPGSFGVRFFMMLNWNELEAQCLSCQKCALADKRTNVVFGVGPRDAEVMFIGEGPGENEDLQGEPFVGRRGVLNRCGCTAPGSWPGAFSGPQRSRACAGGPGGWRRGGTGPSSGRRTSRTTGRAPW